jgi:hypothetical protein
LRHKTGHPALCRQMISLWSWIADPTSHAGPKLARETLMGLLL